MTHPFDDAPLPRHPELQAMIRAARAQSAPAITVRYEDVQATASRRSRWRVGLLAAAAGIAAVIGWASMRPREPEVAPTIAVADAEPSGAVERRPTVPYAKPGAVEDAQRSVELPSGALVRRLDGGPLPTDETLEGGAYEVRTRDDAASVRVGAKVLEIAAASEVVIDSTEPTVTFRVRSGSARWAAQRSKSSTSRERATELAARAEAAIVAGDNAGAARLLRRLVRQSPSGAAAKTALIDLARLEKKLGRPARAHCAYAAFLARFPADARAPSVRTADEALGVGGACRGLDPR